MIVFSIAHIDQAAELRIEAPAAGGVEGLVLRIEAPGNEFPLTPGEVDLVSDWLFSWAIDRDRRNAIRIEH